LTTPLVPGKNRLDMEISAERSPFVIFSQWMNDALTSAGIKEPTAMTLATVGTSGRPRARIVLCKQWEEDGLVFFTNYLSQKGRDLDHHPFASAVFFWELLGRQITVSGSIEKTSREVSVAYWQSRARASQLSQYISKQSEPLSARTALESALDHASLQFQDKPIPCPDHWGGFRLHVDRYEFWIQRPGRLHERYEFERRGPRSQPTGTKDRNGQVQWTFRQLYP
jgi:pyridoxamine 5'-phosphate oxidase